MTILEEGAGPEVEGRAAPQVGLTVRNVSKTFGGQHALRSVDFDLEPGEIHALVGQNGSGKSTFIKILAGYHQPAPGASAWINGEPFDLGSSESAAKAGLRFVHQDLGLVPALGALDNLALGRGYRCGRTGSISWRAEEESAKAALSALGYALDVRKPVALLSAAERTGIAIARALDTVNGEPTVLVLDEPTASLPAAEVARLFSVIRRVQRLGVGIIYVSHRFSEVFEVTDRVTVLRDGAIVGTYQTASLDHDQLVELTVGRAVAAFEEEHDRSASPAGGGEHEGAVLQARGLRGRIVAGVDLDLLPGEVFGIGGVTGSGREELGELVFGGVKRQGSVTVDGKAVPQNRPDLSIRCGLTLVPAERLLKGLLKDRSVRENLTIAGLDDLYGRRGLNRRKEIEEARYWMEKMDVSTKDPETILMTLSGGNQQKVMLARVLRLHPKVLVLDEPTQGVDVGARASIYEIVRNVAEEGAAVLVLSSESEELVALCDRVAVMVQGRLSKPYGTEDLDADDLTKLTVSRSA